MCPFMLTWKPFAVIVMSLPFAYWSTQAVKRYTEEPVSTQSTMNVTIDVKLEFPELTFCIENPLAKKATLDQTQFGSFYAALEHILSRTINEDLEPLDLRLVYLLMLEHFGHPFQDVYIMLRGKGPFLHYVM